MLCEVLHDVFQPKKKKKKCSFPKLGHFGGTYYQQNNPENAQKSIIICTFFALLSLASRSREKLILAFSPHYQILFNNVWPPLSFCVKGGWWWGRGGVFFSQSHHHIRSAALNCWPTGG